MTIDSIGALSQYILNKSTRRYCTYLNYSMRPNHVHEHIIDFIKA